MSSSLGPPVILLAAIPCPDPFPLDISRSLSSSRPISGTELQGRIEGPF